MDKECGRWRGYTPEPKVQIAIDMSDGCMRVCADGIKQHYPSILEQELIEKLR
jgi:hypothetical protein